MPKVILQSNDGENFQVDLKVAEVSGTIKTMLENLGVDGDDNPEPIPLLNVRGEVLKLVVCWAEYHKDDTLPQPEAESEAPKSAVIPLWDKNFLQIGHDLVFELILAANYLDMKGLLDVTCQFVADMINGKSADEIRATFHIKDDLSDAEKEQIRIENSWCSEK